MWEGVKRNYIGKEGRTAVVKRSWTSAEGTLALLKLHWEALTIGRMGTNLTVGGKGQALL